MARFLKIFSVIGLVASVSLYGAVSFATEKATPAPTASPAAAKAGALAKAVQWVGHYTFDPVDGIELWELPLFEEKLKSAVGVANYNKIQSQPWRVDGPQTPIKQDGDILLFSICKQHACMSDGAALFIDVKKDVVSACLFIKGDMGKIEHYWMETGKPSRRLEEAGCAMYEGFELYKNYHQE